MGEFLILPVDFIPLALEAFPEGVDFLLGKGVFVDLVLLVQVTNHFVLVVNVLLDPPQVGGCLAEVLLLGPVHGLGCLFCNR